MLSLVYIIAILHRFPDILYSIRLYHMIHESLSIGCIVNHTIITMNLNVKRHYRLLKNTIINDIHFYIIHILYIIILIVI